MARKTVQLLILFGLFIGFLVCTVLEIKGECAKSY